MPPRLSNGTLNMVMKGVITIMLALLGWFAKQAYDDNKSTQMQMIQKLNTLDDDGDKMRYDLGIMAQILRDKGYKIPDQVGEKMKKGDER